MLRLPSRDVFRQQWSHDLHELHCRLLRIWEWIYSMYSVWCGHILDRDCCCHVQCVWILLCWNVFHGARSGEQPQLHDLWSGYLFHCSGGQLQRGVCGMLCGDIWHRHGIRQRQSVRELQSWNILISNSCSEFIHVCSLRRRHLLQYHWGCINCTV